MQNPGFYTGRLISSYTTLRIGGGALLLAEATNCDTVTSLINEARSSDMRYRVIGWGSNILAADDGYDGAIIVYKDKSPPHFDDAGFVTVSGGYSLSSLIEELVKKGFAGLEKLAGIPGTIGGAIVGNAGAYGTAIGDKLESAQVLTCDSAVKTILAKDLSFDYRHSQLKISGEVLLQATFKLHRAEPKELISEVEKNLADRASKHPNPDVTPTAGSFFKNPIGPGGKRVAAGKLLDECDCKNLRCGGAFLWHKHANIIVTDGNAKCVDVQTLATEMKRRVKAHFGIELEQEVVELK